MQDSQRNTIFQTLELNQSSFEFFAKSVTQEESQILRDVKPDGSAGWTVLEVMSHLRDAEEQFLLRVNCALENCEKAFPVFSPEEMAVEKNYNLGSLESVIQQLKENRTVLFDKFKAVQADEWGYTGVHASKGITSVADLFVQVPLHDAKHVRQLSRMFSER